MSGGTSFAHRGTTRIETSEGWRENNGDVYRTNIYLQEKDGAYIATAAMLSDVSASGNTPQEALENITSELAVKIKGWLSKGEQIPWSKMPSEPTQGSLTRWVFVRLN